jgi:hypothetical protein
MPELVSVSYGKGATREASEQAALRKWDAQFGQANQVAE